MGTGASDDNFDDENPTKEKGEENLGNMTDRDADFSQLENDAAENGQLHASSEDVVSVDQSAGAPESAKIASLKKELEDLNDKYLRALAEFENFKKRSIKERSDLLKYQGERVFFDLLEVVDNLELALQYKDSEPEKLKEGVQLIHKLFVNTLAKWEVRSESGVGKTFDPQRYQAISKVPSADAEPGTIVGELRRAYMFKDKLLRPGEVVVSDKAEVSENEEESQE